ncbi:hypothetical protein [Sphingobium indicum]|nr:hypothetical protein [Sphingobium indicum]
MLATESDNLVDRLASKGFEPMGCVVGEKGVRVAMKSISEGRTLMVDLALVKRSQIAPLVQCRL